MALDLDVAQAISSTSKGLGLGEILQAQIGVLVLSMGIPGNQRHWQMALEVSRAVLEEFAIRAEEGDHR